jgi:hypothetical protein
MRKKYERRESSSMDASKLSCVSSARMCVPVPLTMSSYTGYTTNHSRTHHPPGIHFTRNSRIFGMTRRAQMTVLRRVKQKIVDRDSAKLTEPPPNVPMYT